MNSSAGIDSFVFGFLILGYVILIGYLGWRGWKNLWKYAPGKRL